MKILVNIIFILVVFVATAQNNFDIKHNIDIPLVNVTSHITKIKASSQHDVAYKKDFVVDGKLRTMWVPRNKDNSRDIKKGIGEWLSFKFDKSYQIVKINIQPGSGESRRYYALNNTPSKIQVSSSNENITLNLKDRYGLQSHNLDIEGQEIKLTVLDKWVGKDESASTLTFCLSEIEFYIEDPLMVGLITSIEEDNAKKATKNLKEILNREKNNTMNLTHFKIGNYPILEFAIKNGKPNIVELLFTSYFASPTSANISSINKSSTNEEIIQFARSINSIRAEYWADIKKIKETDLSKMELEKKRELVNTKYAVLWNYEKDDFTRVVTESYKQKEIEELLEVEQDLKNVSLYLSDIDELTKLRNLLSVKFKSLSLEPEFISLQGKIKQKKTEIIIHNHKEIMEIVNNSSETSQLEEYNERFTYYTMRSSEIEDISIKIESKINAIKEEKRQAIINAELERKRQEKIEEELNMAKYGFSFNTLGLSNGELYKLFFKGDFMKIPFNRDNIIFNLLITNYMYAFAENFDHCLPENKVEINETRCVRERVTTNGWGQETSRYCIEYEEFGTGLFSNLDVYNGYVEIQNIANKDILKLFGKMLKSHVEGTMLSDLSRLVNNKDAFESDFKKIIETNGCDNLALKRFEKNLVQFANNEPAIKLDGTLDVKIVDYNKEQDIKRLIENLIYENSKTWSMNEFIRNSISDMDIISKDEQLRPTKISVNYLFEGLFGKQKYNAQITFKRGIPDCLYFQDYSKTCRTPDRKIIQDFVDGKYVLN